MRPVSTQFSPRILQFCLPFFVFIFFFLIRSWLYNLTQEKYATCTTGLPCAWRKEILNEKCRKSFFLTAVSELVFHKKGSKSFFTKEGEHPKTQAQNDYMVVLSRPERLPRALDT